MSEYKYLGIMVKKLRIKNNMTLKQLSEATGLSIGYLSQFERGLATAAIDSLDKIAKVLNTSIGEFFREAPNSGKKQTDKYDLVKSHERVISNIDKAYIQYNLVHNLKAVAFLPRYYEIMPQQLCNSKDDVLYRHEGNEFIFILEGVLTVIVDGTTMYLHEGDSIMINSNRDHTWINETFRITKLIAIHTPNPYTSGTPFEIK